VYNSDGSPINLYGGKNGSLAAFVVTAYMKGVPMIYTGQEVGTTRGMDFFYHTPGRLDRKRRCNGCLQKDTQL
jgi:hypothetical protein